MDVFPAETPGIGTSVIPDKDLHAAARDLAEACESFLVSPSAAGSAEAMQAGLPNIVLLASGSSGSGRQGQDDGVALLCTRE